MHQEIHLSLDFGEIIDLYGLSLIDGVYHIFFLYKNDRQMKQWGHFATKDFLEYKFTTGKADIIGYKTGNTHFFANTNGETLMMELIKPPSQSRRSFFSLPKKVVVNQEEMLKFPAPNLHELREYRRTVQLREGESADTFGAVFEAVMTFPEDIYSLCLGNSILLKCHGGDFIIEHDKFKQSFNAEDFKTIHLFSDTASIEIFVGGRVLSLPVIQDEKGTVRILSGNCRADIYKLKSIIIK